MNKIFFLSLILASSGSFGATVDCSTNKTGERNYISVNPNSSGADHYKINFYIVDEGGTVQGGAPVADSQNKPEDAICSFKSKVNFSCNYLKDAYLRASPVVREGSNGEYNALTITFGVHGKGDFLSNTFLLSDCKYL